MTDPKKLIDGLFTSMFGDEEPAKKPEAPDHGPITHPEDFVGLPIIPENFNQGDEAPETTQCTRCMDKVLRGATNDYGWCEDCVTEDEREDAEFLRAHPESDRTVRAEDVQVAADNGVSEVEDLLRGLGSLQAPETAECHRCGDRVLAGVLNEDGWCEDCEAEFLRPDPEKNDTTEHLEDLIEAQQQEIEGLQEHAKLSQERTRDLESDLRRLEARFGGLLGALADAIHTAR